MSPGIICGTFRAAPLSPGDQAEVEVEVERFGAYLARALARRSSGRQHEDVYAWVVAVGRTTVHLHIPAWDLRRTVPVDAGEMAYELGSLWPLAPGQSYRCRAWTAATRAPDVDPHRFAPTRHTRLEYTP